MAQASDQNRHKDVKRCNALDVLDANAHVISKQEHIASTIRMTPTNFEDTVDNHSAIHPKNPEFERQNRSCSSNPSIKLELNEYDDHKSHLCDINDDIITDIYDSLCSLGKIRIDLNDKKDMNMDEMNAFFHKYIKYNDSNQLSHIAEDIFCSICDQNHSQIESQSVSFDAFVSFIENLNRNEFKKIIFRSISDTVSNHKSFTNSMSPLESIDEHTPLDHHYENGNDGLNEYIQINTKDSSLCTSNDIHNMNVIRTAEITPRITDENKRKYTLKLQKLKKKIKEIDGLKRKLEKGAKLEMNQMKKIEQRDRFEEERKWLEMTLSQPKHCNEFELDDEKFIYRLYEQQCTKQRDKYKESADDMRQKLKYFLLKFNQLQAQNEALMTENESLQKLQQENDSLKQENILLKQRLNKNEKQ